jgi:prepilin peptidase CpaA
LAPLDAIVILISSLSAFFDLRIRKIPNWLIAIGVFSGVGLNAFYGVSQLMHSMAGLVVGILVLLLPFALGWMGAGDVKFFGVVGALLGVSLLPRVFFYSALVAGLIAVAYLVTGNSQLGRLRDLWIDVKLTFLSLGRLLPAPIHKRTESRGGSVPWGVAFAVGTIIAYYFDDKGKWAGF